MAQPETTPLAVGTKYFTPGYFADVDQVTWQDDIVDHNRLKNNWVYLTPEGAKEARDLLNIPTKARVAFV